MTDKPNGLWPFTLMVLSELDKLNLKPLKIEAHDPVDNESSDFLWGEIDLKSEFSMGEYLTISQYKGLFSSDIGEHAFVGGSVTFDGGTPFSEPTEKLATLVAANYAEKFAHAS
ncbi:hypothetical protein [Psychromonas sp. Urea-02u-13]|uniref:hypothetical protein n=1 Tax=Psychromonas sp. Urea-02u-13 TaxID=2058326 RepID=UPI000C322A21|nr:hypothetical protein [Psychromonas sp. Urea-02u-13]PKG37334.1 hypothetical protein CXF74_19390 [Psychromonas sp. Urea-02u-13]